MSAIIYAGDSLLDLYPNTVIALTFQATEVGELSSRSASRSNSIKLPKTENNKRIFGYADDEKTLSSVIYTRISCRVFIDGILIPEMNVLYLEQAGSSFEAAIYSNEVDLFSDLEDKLCSELDFGLSVTLSDTWVTTYKDLSNDFVAALVDYGKGISPQRLKPDIFGSSDWRVVERPRLRPCRLATTGNKTLSGLAAIDGITPVAGDRILVWQQTTPSENGIYIADSGSWIRSEDCSDITQMWDYGVFILWGATYTQDWFVQTNVTGNFSFAGPIPAAGQANFVWDKPKTAFGYFATGRVPYSSYLEIEFPIAAVPNIFGTEAWDVELDWIQTVASGTQGVYVRVYFRKADGGLVVAADDFSTATTLQTASGSISALEEYTHIVIATMFDRSNASVYPSVEIKNYVRITPFDVSGNVQAEWCLPCVKFYRVIEEILDTLSKPYSIEYPNSSATYWQKLLLTYSREHYGYRDASTVVDEFTSINMSKFVCPDVSQKKMLEEWLFRTYSLVRVKNGTIEFKPVFNIIKDKATNSVDWTNKRVAGEEVITLINDNFAQTNYLKDGSSVEDLVIIEKDKYTPDAEVSNEGSFAITDTRLPKEGTAFESIFHSSQTRDDYSGTRITYAPVYDKSSVDRKDFKHKPKLRILEAFVGTAFGPAYYYNEASTSNVAYTTYRFLSSGGTDIPGANPTPFIDKAYSNMVAAIQKSKVIERYYMLNALDIGSLDLFKTVYDNQSYFMIISVSNYISGKPTKVTLLKI